MNTLPWDANDSIKGNHALLLCCLGVSLILHLTFFIYFNTLEKEKIEKKEEQVTTLKINLRTASHITKKPKQISSSKKIIENKPVSKKNKISKNTLTTKRTIKPAKQQYSALEKVAPLPIKKHKKEKMEYAQKTHAEPVEKIETIDTTKEIVDTTNVINEEKTIEYKALLERWLSHYKKYPIASKKKRQEDIVVVSFTLNAKGQLLSHEIKKASNYRLLNKAVIKMLKKANPMPAIPEEIRGNKTTFSYTIPIEFYLNRL